MGFDPPPNLNMFLGGKADPQEPLKHRDERTEVQSPSLKDTAEAQGLTSITGLSPAIFSHKASDEFRVNILAEYPWIKIDAIDEAAQHCRNFIEDFVTKQRHHMEAARSRSSFMSLSRELRDMIYDLALTPEPVECPQCDCINWLYPEDVEDEDPVEISKPWQYGRHSICVRRPACIQKNEANQRALTQVSKVIRAETVPIYYSKNHFGLEVTLNMSDEFELGTAFFRGLGTGHARLLRRLVVFLPLCREEPEWPAAKEFARHALYKLGVLPTARITFYEDAEG